MGHHRAALLSLSLLAATAAGAPGWRTVQETRAGKALVEERAGLATVPAALRAGLQDLAPVLGSAPLPGRAWLDSRNPRQGGVTFEGRLGGVPVKGLLTCRLGPRARLAAIFVRADAPAAEWQRLVQPAPAPAAAGSGAGRTVVFADGTGRLTLPPGWTTDARTAMQPVVVRGPGEQVVLSGVLLTVQTPAAPFRTPGGLVAAPGTPAQVFAAISPQLSQASARAGGPSHVIDHLAVVQDLPGGRASLLTFGLTETTRQGTRHHRSQARIELAPLTATSFLVGAVQVRAPDATYERDLPVMLGILRSLVLDDEVIARKSRQAVAAQQRWFAGQQAAHRAQVEAFEAHNRQWEASQRAQDARTRDWEDRQTSRARSNDDFDELIRGYRTVEDTVTGEKRSVDLHSVDRLVEDLNRADPERYRQIPLRDEADPLPAR